MTPLAVWSASILAPFSCDSALKNAVISRPQKHDFLRPTSAPNWFNRHTRGTFLALFENHAFNEAVSAQETANE